METEAVRKPIAAAVLLAFAAIYFVWGSTFLAIRIVVAELPPLLAAGLRFTIAGLLLYCWVRFFTRAVPPTRVEWRNALFIGFFMFFIAYGCLFWAEKSVPSGIAAVLVAAIPLWTILLEYWTNDNERPGSGKLVALLIGVVGVAIVSLNGQSLHAGLLPSFAILGSSLAWSIGSILSKRLQLPKSKACGASMQMLTGGVLLILTSELLGDLAEVPHPSAAVWAALLYLIFAGSILAFTCYVYLLHRLPASSVASYAYVNPLVALLLGAWIGREQITTTTLIGTALVIGSVILILRAGRT